MSREVSKGATRKDENLVRVCLRSQERVVSQEETAICDAEQLHDMQADELSIGGLGDLDRAVSE